MSKSLASPRSPTQVSTEALKISSPWELRAVQLKFRKRKLIFHVARNPNVPIYCLECGQPCGLCGRSPVQGWRHLKRRFSIIIYASLPRCRCPDHGIKTARAPWERPGGDYVACDVSRLENVFSRIHRGLSGVFRNQSRQDLFNSLLIKLRSTADLLRQPIIARSVARVPLRALDVTLPLNQDPPYKTYHSFGAHPLGILGAVSDLTPLLASDYINLSCLKDPEEDGLLCTTIVPRRTIRDFIARGYCECFEAEGKPSFTPSNIGNIVSWLVERIREKYYVFAHVNEYYIPGMSAHLKTDFAHDALIVGCDTSRRVFKVAAYFADGRYTVANLSFEHLVMAITLLGNRSLVGDSICSVPMLLAVRPREPLRLSFDRRAACTNLADYVLSRPPDESITISDDPTYAGDWSAARGYPIGSHRYGSSAFAAIAEHVRDFSEKKRRIDMRDTRALWEQKKILHANVRVWSVEARLPQASDFVESYAEMVNWAQRLHLLVFAYNIRGRKGGSDLKLHLEKADYMQQAERRVLEPILEALICRQSTLRHAPISG